MERVDRGENDLAQDSVKYPGWKAMPYLIGNESFEKLGTMGTMANQLVYLTTIFQMKNVEAVTMMNIAAGTAAMAPLLGAFLSDNYIGRYATLAFASLASLLGMVLLTLTAAITNLHPPACNQHVCQGSTPSQLFVLISAYFLSSSERVVSALATWHSALTNSTQSNISWAIGLGIPAVLMVFSCIAFFIGTKLYVIVKPQGSPFTGFVQVPVAAFKKRWVKISELPDKELFDPPRRSSLATNLLHTNQFKFLDKAAVVTPEDKIQSNGEAADPWRLCTVQQVELVKCFIRIIPIWFSCVLFYIPQSQHNNYTVYQAQQMDRRLGRGGFQIPAGSFVVFNMLTLTVWIPIYDRLIVPQLKKITKHEEGITVLQRMGVGIAISILGMVVSALVEQRRRCIALHKPPLEFASTGGTISSMSSFWLLPQLILFGLCEAFNMIGQTEFFYHQFPDNMKSVGMAVFFLGQAVSNYASGILVMTVHKATGRNGSRNWLAQDLNKGRLDLFYLTVSGLGMFNLVYFIICAKYYQFNSTANGANPRLVPK
ncbi:Major facilitator superfamily protein [Rhynchospora pubera]|uniref:Major facilitator superfamily protein n=1 Tax=Rhynchospora pubera TaxID=906938 RepID=A0AAV8DLK5_9POAL|nr:Major facilitator superfamily protein [Rhynchospora pubera]